MDVFGADAAIHRAHVLSISAFSRDFYLPFVKMLRNAGCCRTCAETAVWSWKKVGGDEGRWGCGVSGVPWASPAGPCAFCARELCSARPTGQRWTDSAFNCHRSPNDLSCFPG
uniref:Uncharacterized protein n=1 Tax=Mus musculus TaxID=10090 RepID=Q8C6Y9_MOUSE|nr:unnamed protein product [Mus musculus]